VANTSMLPSAAAASTPDGDTVAIAGFELCHVARFVTSLVVPSRRVAVANNCRVSPGARFAGALPLTPTATLVVPVGDAGVDGVLPPPPATSTRATHRNVTPTNACARMRTSPRRIRPLRCVRSTDSAVAVYAGAVASGILYT